MNFFKKHLILLVILCAAAFLRLYNLGEFSLTNDELSALVRTEYHSFNEMMDHGVKVDAHPAGVQVFLYYWVMIFGSSEWMLRLPFAVAGIVSIFLLYLLGKRWFGKTSGLLAAAACATFQFPVLYSQLARPYAPGLMFTLSAAWFWTLVLFPQGETGKSKKLWSATGLALSLAACAFTHYFSMLMAGIMAGSGIFFLKKENFKPFFAACITGIILFLPHLQIFFRQLSYGGVGSWLGVPKGDFLGNYFDYCLNDSLWIRILMIALPAVSLFLSGGRPKNLVFYILCIAWFIVPYGVGYWYSIKINPVLQYSTLLFSFPFLLLFFTGFTRDEKVSEPLRILLVSVLLLAGILSTAVEKKYYSTRHFGVFKELAENTLKWNKQYGSGNITTVLNVTSPKYVGYYFNKYQFNPDVRMYYVADHAALAALRDLLDTAHTAYFNYGWSNIHHPYEVPALVREKYPFVVEQDTFFNSGISLYGMKGIPRAEDKLIFHSESTFEENRWNEEEKNRSDERAHAGTYSENMEDKEYGVTFSEKITGIDPKMTSIISFSAWFLASDTTSDGQLVISFENDGKPVLWTASPTKAFNRQPGQWQKIIICQHIPDELPPSGEVKCYFWNPGKKKVFVDDLSVTARDRAYYR